jgi:hypothetical protein
MLKLGESQKVILDAESELAIQTRAEAKAAALKALQDSEEFFVLARKNNEIESQIMTTDSDWVMQGFYEYLTAVSPKSLKPSVDKIKLGLDMLSLAIFLETRKKGASQ